MYDEYGARGYVPLAINLWQDMNSVVKYYARQYTYPFFRDGGGMWNLYNISNSIPLNYVIDTAGIVVGGMVGFNEATLRSWIEPYLTGVAEGERLSAPEFTRVFPNPAGRRQTVCFNLPRAGQVSLRVYSAAGELVRTIFSGVVPAGQGAVEWDLTDRRGECVPNGLYFYELSTGSTSVRMKVSVLR